jgi:hypothetical protein
MKYAKHIANWYEGRWNNGIVEIRNKQELRSEEKAKKRVERMEMLGDIGYKQMCRDELDVKMT